MVRGPAALLGIPVACLAAALYVAIAPDLPSLGAGDAAFVATVGAGLAIVAALVVVLFPLRELRSWLAPLIVIEALVAVGLTGAGFLETATVFKVLAASMTGLFLARFVPVPALAYAIAALVLVVDIVSVAAGPTKVLIEQHPRATEYLTLSIPEWGDPNGGAGLGVSDIVFLGGYLFFAWRFGLRRTVTAVALGASLILSLVAGVVLDRAVPALPLLSLALVLPNVDIAARQLKLALAAARKR